jgi:hypothetical protein
MKSKKGEKSPYLQIKILNMTLEEKIKAFPVIVYDRVVGWLTPVKNFNAGKAQERMDRKQYKQPE